MTTSSQIEAPPTTELDAPGSTARVSAPAPWWKTAPNPACVSWCESSHEAGEFNDGGGFTCEKTIARNELFVVTVQSFIGADYDGTPGVLEIDPAGPFVHLTRHELSPEEARVLALAIQEAAAVAEATVR